MANTLIFFSYDGTNYSGFQIQPNAVTIQEKIEKALKVLYKEPVRLHGAGRTDAGVHARAQAGTFEAPFAIRSESLPYAINTLLPTDIVVTAAHVVHDDFHARFSASKKHYLYTIDRAKFPQVLKRLYSWHQPESLDLSLLKEAAALFQGTHDFKAFQAAGSDVKETTRTIDQIKVLEEKEAALLKIYFTGSGFLYRMVRLITGTLVRVGRGKLEISAVKEALNGGSPAAAGPTAPAHGLCLENIIYDR